MDHSESEFINIVSRLLAEMERFDKSRIHGEVHVVNYRRDCFREKLETIFHEIREEAKEQAIEKNLPYFRAEMFIPVWRKKDRHFEKSFEIMVRRLGVIAGFIRLDEQAEPKSTARLCGNTMLKSTCTQSVTLLHDIQTNDEEIEINVQLFPISEHLSDSITRAGNTYLNLFGRDPFIGFHEKIQGSLDFDRIDLSFINPAAIN